MVSCLPIATASDRWSQEETQWSINTREPLAVECGLQLFHLSIANSTEAIFSDNLIALVYLLKRGVLVLQFSTP